MGAAGFAACGAYSFLSLLQKSSNALFFYDVLCEFYI